MTGFGSADGTVLGGRLRIEIRTVNHRYFNPQFRLPLELSGIEGELRDRLRALLERGHVSVSARWLAPPETEVAVSLDLARARQVVAALRELKKKLRLKGEPDLAFVARHADVLTVASNGGEGAAPVTWADVQPLAEQAAGDVLAMREREGKALATDLAARLDALEAHAAVVAERAPARLAAEYERLKKAVAELAAGSGWTSSGSRRKSRYWPTAWTSPRSWSDSGPTSARAGRRCRETARWASSSGSWRRSCCAR